jgi:hypothetical protein
MAREDQEFPVGFNFREAAGAKPRNPRIHRARSKTSGKDYELIKMRSEGSFWLPVWHYRRAGDGEWLALSCDTLAEARAELNA